MAMLPLHILHLAGTLCYSETGKPGIGNDSILVYESLALVRDDLPDGPRVCKPMPNPVFQGTISGSESTLGGDYILEPGDYVFSQWRPEQCPSLPEALEELVRQAWWEGHALAGPWIVRTIYEDGRTAVQGLRRRKTSH